MEHDLIEIGLVRQNMIMLTRRAATDKDFRSLCLEDAGRAYLHLTGQILPERYAVRFSEPDQEIPLDNTARWVLLPRYLPETWLG